MKKILIPFCLLGVAPAMAGDDQLQSSHTQQMFRVFSEEVGVAATLCWNVAPAKALGVLGFNRGVEATFTKTNDNRDYWTKAAKGGDPPSRRRYRNVIARE